MEKAHSSSNEEGEVFEAPVAKQRKKPADKSPKEGKRPKTAKREYKEDASKVSKKDRLKEYMKSFGYDNEELAELYGMEDDDDGLGDMSYEQAMAELAKLTNGMGSDDDDDDDDKEDGEGLDDDAKLERFIQKMSQGKDDAELGGDFLGGGKKKKKKLSAKEEKELYMSSEQFELYSRGMKEDNLVRKQKEDYLRMLNDAEYLMKELKQVEKQLIQLHLG